MDFVDIAPADITLDTDEYGIWLVMELENGLVEQLGHVSWYEITKRIKQQLIREKAMDELIQLGLEEE